MDANGSIVDRVNGERLVLLGWPRAILMQVAHPLVAAGVARHSTFRSSPTAPVKRLHHTVRAMLGLTFGSDEDQARVIGAIRDIHTRVHGTLGQAVGRFPSGAPYSAEDPALLLWVHATLIDTTLMVYEDVVARLSDAERDEYCRASAGVAVALGADSASVPRDWESMRALVDERLMSGDLVVGADARSVAGPLLRSAVIRMTGPLGWASQLLTVGWMPPSIRAQYGFAWDADRERRFRRLVGLVRLTRPWMPKRLALWAGVRKAET